MTRSARNYVGLAILMLCALAGVMIFQFRGPLARLAAGKGSPRIIRHSVTVKPARLAVGSLENLAPLATVSVSSAIEDHGQWGEGVADGVVDSRDWLTEGEGGGAWIKLSWDQPVAVMEVDLFDLPSPVNNILQGTLIFDDGSQLPVSSLAPDGTRRRLTIPPKTVSWLMFRIDRSQGPITGLAEIMVLGKCGDCR